MVGSDRRRHVRVKPSRDLPFQVALLGDGVFHEALDVVDVSVGGLAVASPALQATALDARMRLKLSVGVRADDVHDVDAVVRWVTGETVGIELVDPPTPTAKAIERYVVELLERGSSP